MLKQQLLILASKEFEGKVHSFLRIFFGFLVNLFFSWLDQIIIENINTWSNNKIFKTCLFISQLISVALDAIMHGPSLTSHRRHSVSVCQTPTSSSAAPLSFCQKKISIDQAEDDTSLRSSSSLCSSQRSLTTESGVSSPDVELAGYSLNTPAMHANLHTEFIHSVSQCQTLLIQPIWQD